MHSGYRSRRPWKCCRFIQLSKTTVSRTPTRAADGHADSHDEYGMGLCRRMCKLLIVQSEIVVIVIINQHVRGATPKPHEFYLHSGTVTGAAARGLRPCFANSPLRFAKSVFINSFQLFARDDSSPQYAS